LAERPAAHHPRPMAKKPPAYRLGIDLGGTKIHVVVIDRKGRVTGSARCATKGERGYPAVVERIARTAREALDDADLKPKEVGVCGLGAPGPVDPASGRIHMAPNLGWADKPLARDLGKQLGLRVVLGNDVNCGALGEIAYGAAAEATSAVAAFVGTGLGGAVVIGGSVVNGANGYGGEIGHIPSPFGEALCGCGRRGCLETVASKTGLVRAVAQAAAAGRKCLLDTSGTVKSSAILAALEAGCPATRAAVDQLERALAWGLCAIGNTVDPQVFILGGGLAETLGKPTLARIAAHMADTSNLYRRSKPRLVMAKLGDDAVAVGAAVLSEPERA
jgi:glucokinase